MIIKQQESIKREIEVRQDRSKEGKAYLERI